MNTLFHIYSNELKCYIQKNLTGVIIEAFLIAKTEKSE